jgi:hypothetical protein
MLIGHWYTHSIYSTRTGRSPVVPIWFEWPEVEEFHDNEREILLGDSLLVCPVFDENATEVNIVKPPGVWYDFVTGESIRQDFAKEVTLDDIPVFVRGGRIVPLYRTPNETTISTITSPLTLLIAGDDHGHAEGSIYLDDGVSFRYEEGEFIQRNFTFDNNVLRSVKGSVSEKEVPVFLVNAIVSSLDIYLVKPDGTSEVKHISGLDLKVSDEWTWVDPCPSTELSMKEDKSLKLWVVSGCVTVVAVACTILLVVLKNRRKCEEEEGGASDQPLKDSTDRSYT